MRKPIPASLVGVDSQLPSRVFTCKLDSSSQGYKAIRPSDAAASQLPDVAVCFCAASINSEGVASAQCHHRGNVCTKGSAVTLDLYSPGRVPIHLPELQHWTEALHKQVVGNSCGNGIVEAWEACDDGNSIGADGCAANCRSTDAGFTCATPGKPCDTTCGDGILAGKEQCDDGNKNSGDGCSGSCKVETVCSRKVIPETFRLPSGSRGRMPPQKVYFNLGGPMNHKPFGSVRAAVPALAGLASCASLECPKDCTRRTWKPGHSPALLSFSNLTLAGSAQTSMTCNGFSRTIKEGGHIMSGPNLRRFRSGSLLRLRRGRPRGHRCH